MNDLPQELHFHIGLYLPFVEAHYFITSLYHRPNCEPFWQQYLMAHFHVQIENINQYTILSCKTLCRSFAIRLKQLFDKRCYPKINYFDNVLIKYLKEEVLYKDLDSEPNNLVSGLGGTIKLGPIPFLSKFLGEKTAESVSHNICIEGLDEDMFLMLLDQLNNTGRRPPGYELVNIVMIELSDVEKHKRTVYTKRLMSMRNDTDYMTPKGIVSVNFDIDYYYKLENGSKSDEATEHENLDVLIFKGLMRTVYNRIIK